jgi:3-phenylpropionate/trans-cinnamate dioxygenase ferredoxin component
MGGWTGAGPAERQGDLHGVVLEGHEIALARLADGSWVAFDDTCTHEECPLSEGDVEDGRIICYCHGSEFDLRTGEVLEGPAEDPLTMHPVRVEDGELQVELH